MKQAVMYFFRGINWSRKMIPNHGKFWIIGALCEGLEDSLEDYGDALEAVPFDIGALIGVMIFRENVPA